MVSRCRPWRSGWWTPVPWLASKEADSRAARWISAARRESGEDSKRETTEAKGIVMGNRKVIAASWCAVLMGLVLSFSPAQAAGLPLIISTTVNYTNGALTINGQNFGSSASVTLDSMTFPTVSSSSSQVVANFPSGTPPSSFAPGTYFLTIQFKNQLPAIFAVDIGANGPAGATGAAGPQGSIGLPGPQGVAGPAGPTGATGATGAAGPVGPTGATGSVGPAGVPGATGPQGPPGTNGTNGTGAPICSASDTVVSYQGALACKSTLPRYVANGDGTVTDNQTGLMWEVQTSTCSGEVTCYSNTYDWSATGSAADGTLFTTLIAGLKGGDYYNPSIGQIYNPGLGSACFVNHCDWRIPTVAELQTIIELTAPGCSSGSPCIDPAFGPTQTGVYWSFSSQVASSANNFFAWHLYFGTSPYGNAGSSAKDEPYYARAVRSGR